MAARVPEISLDMLDPMERQLILIKVVLGSPLVAVAVAVVQ
jgi:hypothetical protein